MINFAKTVIEQSRVYSNKIAYRDGTDDLTYGELIDRVPRVAQGLLNAGVTQGDHVIITMEDCVDWPVVFLACLYTGVVPLPLSTAMGRDLFWKMVKFVDCKLIISGNDPIEGTVSRRDIQQWFDIDSTCMPILVHPDSAAWMNVSSGSTGMPKVAVHRHQTLFEMLRMSPFASFGMTQDSVILSTPKMSWNYGLQNSITYTLGLGATAIVIQEAPAGPTVFEYINRYRPDIVISSPSIIRRLLATRDKYTLPDSVKHFNSSGEHLPSSMYEQFLKRFGLPLHGNIGMMETASNYAANSDFEHDAGTVGKPLPGCQVKLVNSQGNTCTDSEIGEIYVSSPANACYYYNNYEKTKQTFCGEWVKTGDLAYWNHNKNLCFVGRVDDVFKVNDLIVSPVEVESAIMQHAAIDQVAVAGVKNAKGIAEVHAFVVVNDNFDLKVFKEFLTKTLFAHQYPKHIHQVLQLPETMTNKKDRKTVAKLITHAD